MNGGGRIDADIIDINTALGLNYSIYRWEKNK